MEGRKIFVPQADANAPTQINGVNRFRLTLGLVGGICWRFTVGVPIMEKEFPLQQRKNAMKIRVLAIALLTPVLSIIFPPSSTANGLNQRLQQAICGQNWRQGVNILQEMKQLAPQQAVQLTAYQSRLQVLADRNIFITDWNCANGGLPAATTPAAAPQVFTIPIIRREGNIPVVEVTFNGQTFPMLFDTGASTTFILPSMARAIQPEIKGRGMATVADGRNVPTTIAEVATLEVGNLSLSNVVVTFSEDTDELALEGVGLLGQNVYGAYDIAIRENVIELTIRSNSGPTNN
ncbi:MAG: hypothetical protein EA366_15390 [Spirulina sp. DLM2.Bin59]|nr:MAG: hypothetical protein EA366_15390 [Spirulina sp. DLM2.Bin59]